MFSEAILYWPYRYFENNCTIRIAATMLGLTCIFAYLFLQRLREHQQELNQFRLIKENEVNKEREELEAFKRELHNQLRCCLQNKSFMTFLCYEILNVEKTSRHCFSWSSSSTILSMFITP